jgi:hypothetical protein
VKNYINRPEEHHRIRTFEEEYVDFLKDSGIEYDEKFVPGYCLLSLREDGRENANSWTIEIIKKIVS